MEPENKGCRQGMDAENKGCFGKAHISSLVPKGYARYLACPYLVERYQMDGMMQNRGSRTLHAAG